MEAGASRVRHLRARAGLRRTGASGTLRADRKLWLVGFDGGVARLGEHAPCEASHGMWRETSEVAEKQLWSCL